MIIIPNVKPENLRGMEADFGSSIAATIWRKVVNNHTWVERAFPIGAVLFFYESITKADGSPKDPPNPNIWKFCDGSVVSDADSPLDGQNVPDLRDYFLKGSDTEGLIGGNATLNIQHNHGGATGITDDNEDFIADVGSDHSIGSPHYHSLGNSWSTAEPIIPKYFAVNAYIRIK